MAQTTEGGFEAAELAVEQAFLEQGGERRRAAAVSGGERLPDSTELPEDWGGIGNEGNSFADPRFIDVSTKDFHLLADSPCIDAGDPESPADVDGSRTDMGAFPFLGEPVTLFDRGDANGDGATDISDGVTILLFLFGGHNDILPCDDAADVDDTGDLTLTDAVVLLNYLLQGGTPPSAPFGDCGTDPTDDALDCADSC